MEEPSQRCGRCKETLPLETFSPSYRGRPGTYCRPCVNAYHKGLRDVRPNPALVCQWCKAEYVPQQLKGRPMYCSRNCKEQARKTARRVAVKACREVGCPQPALEGRYLCATHTACRAKGCDKPRTGGAFCPKHKADARKQRLKAEGALCVVDGCPEVKHTRDWCKTHYNRWQKTGDVGPAARLKAPAGSRFLTNEGYVKRTVNGKRVPEHRLVMEQMLGRPLEKYEYVHHKNGRRADNSPKNLELWITPQPKGQRPEDLVEWIVEEYPELVRAALNDEPLTLF